VDLRCEPKRKRIRRSLGGVGVSDSKNKSYGSEGDLTPQRSREEGKWKKEKGM